MAEVKLNERRSPKIEVYLDLVSKLYGEVTLRECAKRAGVKWATVQNSWRVRYEDFRPREIAAKKAALRKRQQAIGTASNNTAEPDEFELQRFFDLLYEHEDRLKAAKELGLQWKAVKEAIQKSNALKARYREFQEERKVKAEDILWKDVLGGSTTAAHKYLQAHDPVWASKAKVEVGHTHKFDPASVAEARQAWLSRTGLPALPPAENGDGEVEDAEYVEEEPTN